MKTLYQSLQMAMLCIITLLLSIPLKAQTSLSGNIVDEETGESIPFGNIALFNNGVYITSVKTDSKGNYCFTNVDAGTYNIEVRFLGYSPRLITNALVKEDKINTLNVKTRLCVGLCEIIIYDHRPPLIEKDHTTQGNIFVADPRRNTLILP